MKFQDLKYNIAKTVYNAVNEAFDFNDDDIIDNNENPFTDVYLRQLKPGFILTNAFNITYPEGIFIQETKYSNDFKCYPCVYNPIDPQECNIKYGYAFANDRFIPALNNWRKAYIKIILESPFELDQEKCADSFYIKKNYPKFFNNLQELADSGKMCRYAYIAPDESIAILIMENNYFKPCSIYIVLIEDRIEQTSEKYLGKYNKLKTISSCLPDVKNICPLIPDELFTFLYVIHHKVLRCYLTDPSKEILIKPMLKDITKNWECIKKNAAFGPYYKGRKYDINKDVLENAQNNNIAWRDAFKYKISVYKNNDHPYFYELKNTSQGEYQKILTFIYAED